MIPVRSVSVALVCSAALFSATALRGQAPAFEAASIKVNRSGEARSSFRGTLSGISVTNQTPLDITRDDLVAMMKTMLAERFNLAVHQETRPIPVYALVLARSDGRLGPTLRQRPSEN
jgi:hypothetical protein